MVWPRPRPLFAFAALSVGLALAVAGVGASRSAGDAWREAAGAHAEALAEQHAARTDLQVERLRADLQAWVRAEGRLAELLTGLEQADPTERARRLAAVRTSFGAHGEWWPASGDWVVSSGAGTVLARSGAEPAPGREAPGACRTSHDGRSVEVAVRPGGVGLITLQAPVLDAAGMAVGQVCVSVPLEAPHGGAAEATSAVYLLDGAGRVLQSSLGPALHRQLGAALANRPLRVEGAGAAWHAQYPVEGVLVTAAWAPLAAVQGGVLVEVPPTRGPQPWSPWAGVLGVLGGVAALGGLGLLARGSVRAAPKPAPTPAPRDDDHELAELLLNALDSRVAVISPQYRVLRANSASLRRYSDLLARDAHEVFEGARGPCKTCPVCLAFATGRPVEADDAEGSGSLTELVHVRATPMLDAAGQVYAVLRLSRVVTAERQLQAELMLREKMSAFGLLAAGVAHEIGNPLAAIVSQLHLARAGRDPELAQTTLEVVAREVTRIQELLRDLINFARRPRTGHSLVSLDTVVEDVWRLISHEPRAQRVTIERHQATAPPAVHAKVDHLVQVLLNLGLNALDAMPDGGTLTFATAVEGAWAVVRVTDTGHGIPASVQGRLFEPFFSTKDVGRGTGLGLFVSRGIVRELKGSLVIEHTGAEGTVFCLRLPLVVP